MRVVSGRSGLVALLVASACSDSAPARSQWEVYVGTDAPVPAFGQVLAIELVDSRGNLASQGDVRLLDVSRPSAWPASFGIVPSSAAPPRIRARLYRLDQVGSGVFPSNDALIDATATLPVAVGITVVALPLIMRCFGVAPDLEGHKSCDPQTGVLADEPTLAPTANPATLPIVGSWPPAKIVPCTDAPAGMVCIPGGAFLMGSPRYAAGIGPPRPVPEHLIELSPFAIDADEVTVGQVRQLVASKGLPAPQKGDFQTFNTTAYGPCTYAGEDDPSHDSYPVNCVTWDIADQACRLLGKRLPTEAEWEYVAGNLDEKSLFPWGSDPDVCAHAIVAFGRSLVTYESTECRVLTDGTVLPSGLVPGGSDKDRTLLGVKNLGGSVNEWVAGYFDPYVGSCWNTGALLKDPDCRSAPGMERPLRGGAWTEFPDSASTYFRNYSVSEGTPDPPTGFRCAK